MKKIFLTCWMTVLMVAAFGQQKETRKLGSFKGIKVSQAIDVYLKKGDKEEARVEISGESKITLEDVLTDVSGTTLRVHLASGSWRRIEVKVYVTFVSLEKISASSAANVFSDAMIKSSTMEISASSAGSVEVAVDATNVTADASSAGRIELEGTAKSLDVEASSAGNVDAYGLNSEVVNARASSGGSVKVMALKEIEGHASSGGDVRYRGNPSKTNTGSSSGGSVKKSN